MLADRGRSCAATHMSERVRVSRHILAKFDRRDRVLAILDEQPNRRDAEPGAPAHVAVAISDVVSSGLTIPTDDDPACLLLQQQPADSEQQCAAGAQG